MYTNCQSRTVTYGPSTLSVWFSQTFTVKFSTWYKYNEYILTKVNVFSSWILYSFQLIQKEYFNYFLNMCSILYVSEILSRRRAGLFRSENFVKY